MTEQANINTSLLQQWFSEKLHISEVETKLSILGLDEETFANHLREFKKLRNAKRQTTGFVLNGIGAFLGFISCVITMISFSPVVNDIFMYGMTSVAVVMVMYGLYMVFE